MIQHHTYIAHGISEEAMRAYGVKKTLENPELEYFVHHHSYDMYDPNRCNAWCQVIHFGEVENVTQTDDAKGKTYIVE